MRSSWRDRAEPYDLVDNPVVDLVNAEVPAPLDRHEQHHRIGGPVADDRVESRAIQLAAVDGPGRLGVLRPPSAREVGAHQAEPERPAQQVRPVRARAVPQPAGPQVEGCREVNLKVSTVPAAMKTIAPSQVRASWSQPVLTAACQLPGAGHKARMLPHLTVVPTGTPDYGPRPLWLRTVGALAITVPIAVGASVTMTLVSRGRRRSRRPRLR